MPWPRKKGKTHYHAQLELPDKVQAIKWLVVCNDWDINPLDLLNNLALGCYNPAPEALIVFKPYKSHLKMYGINRRRGGGCIDQKKRQFIRAYRQRSYYQTVGCLL